MASAQEIYSYWWTWQPPWLAWRQLWIEVIAKISSDMSSIVTGVTQVRCSGNDFSGDPDNICGDRNPPPICPPPSGGAPLGGPVCTIRGAITEGEINSAVAWKNSRAKIFFHEALTYEMPQVKFLTSVVPNSLQDWRARGA